MEQRSCALVLGAKVVDGRASPALRRRAEHAARLWLGGRVERIVCSGSDRWGGPSEAAVAAAVCREMGVPEAALVLEERAANTEENLRFSMGLVGDARVVVVTDRAHGARARLLARRMRWAVEVSAPPSPPWSRARVKRVLREGVALVWVWVRG